MNNLKAPRYRPKCKLSLDEDFFKYLFEKHPVLKYKYTESQIRDIVIKFNKKCVDKIIDYRYGVELPIFNKHIFIASFPIKNKRAVNYKLLNATNQKTYLNNLDTNGRMAKIYPKEMKHRFSVKNVEFYQFKWERDFTRACSKAFKENWIKYIEINYDNDSIPIDYDNYVKDTNSIENYNEFAL